MDIRRATYGATIRLAVVFSVIAAAVALALDAIGGVPPTVVVLAVIVVGFLTSWVLTDRVAHRERRPVSHRLAVVPLRHPVG